jgi:hypothetical protein
MSSDGKEKHHAFLEDVETVYEMWTKSDFNSEQQSHLGNLMFNIVKEAKVFPQAFEFYSNLRFILRVIPDMYNYQMQFYLSFLGRLNDPYDYLKKDTLVQTYKTAVDNYKPVGCFGYVSTVPVDLSDQGTNAQGEWEDLTKRLRTGKIY